MKEENDAIKGASSSILIFLFALLVVPPDGDPVLRLVQVVPAWTNKKFMSLNQWWGRIRIRADQPPYPVPQNIFEN